MISFSILHVFLTVESAFQLCGCTGNRKSPPIKCKLKLSRAWQPNCKTKYCVSWFDFGQITLMIGAYGSNSGDLKKINLFSFTSRYNDLTLHRMVDYAHIIWKATFLSCNYSTFWYFNHSPTRVFAKLCGPIYSCPTTLKLALQETNASFGEWSFVFGRMVVYQVGCQHSLKIIWPFLKQNGKTDRIKLFNC